MVKSISEVCRKRITPRVLGFDDAPFQSRPRLAGSEVHAVGIVTSGDRFEGMLYVDKIEQDGLNAQERIVASTLGSKFHAQIHAVLVDGLTMGGLNVIDIMDMAERLQRPIISVMRSKPDLAAMLDAVERLSHADIRWERLQSAGPIHQVRDWVFQYRFPARAEAGAADAKEGFNCPEEIATLLDKCTPSGTQKVPECLRIAHLVGAAVKTGQSSSSA